MSHDYAYNFDFIVQELGGLPHHCKGRERTRMKVRIRDAFRCRSCGALRTIREVVRHNKRCKTGKNKIKLFDVHHLDGECGKNSRGYDSGKDISRLVTLCHKCHYNHHQFSKRGIWTGNKLEQKRVKQALREGNQKAIAD